ncbi:hypothetical protein RN001_007008 [Aquatica leii]|uniref:E3 UFM1-protein ligase 1 homolog n=1 Tax=Aquatica leii TaxID=1421715 RepID=A0AAN7PEB6_9COLE|nr:hypothetical protein RN001_007008 [Aquatica leii]
MFFSLFEQLSPYGFLTARTTTAMYVPNVYSRSQNEWVQNFYKQNGYVEFDALIRLGINDAKAYLKKQFVNENIMTLKSCVISQNLLERIEADIDECISSKSYVDLQSNLPNALNDDDIKLIVDKVLTLQKQRNIIILGNYLLSKAFIESLMKECEIYLQDQVKRLVESGEYQQYQTDLRVSNKPQKGDDLEEKVDKREERRKKAAGGKSGGGTQGRETKTKSTKKPTKMVKNDEDDRDEVGVSKKGSLQVVCVEDVEKLIEKRVEEEGLSEIIDDIANYAAPILNSNGLEIARKLYETTVADRTAARRHTHNDAQNKVNALLGDVRLFEKGVKCFTVDAQQNLYKYLLKTVCLDILNELLDYIASERGLNIDADKFNNEQRQKFINDLPVEYKSSFQILLKTVLGQNLDEFMTAVEECLTLCSMILKKIDKKKDRLIILNHKHSLLEQLDKCEDPALVLHLSSLVIFITATQCMLHCSGRHVSTVLIYLKQYLTSEHSSELCSYHDLVTLLLNNGSEEESIKEQLKEKMSVIKAIANDFKKGTSDKS